MDKEVATDNVIDTTISHNMGSKFMDYVIFYNSHTTLKSCAKNVAF
jgi:hypothetical protein